MPDWLWIQEVVFPLIGMAMGAGVLYGIYRTANRLIDRKQDREALPGGAGAAEIVSPKCPSPQGVDRVAECVPVGKAVVVKAAS